MPQIGPETAAAGMAGPAGTRPRPPFTDRVTPGQWQAVDVAAAVVVALWAVFDLRLRHGFRSNPACCQQFTGAGRCGPRSRLARG
jgi:hypothetical protein